MTRSYRPRQPPRGGRAAVNRRWLAECGTASDAGSDRTDRSTRARVFPPDAAPRRAVPRRCISPDTPCCVPTVAGFYPATLTGRLPLFAVRHLPTVCGFPATYTGRVCACHWGVALFFVARHLPTVCGFPATDTGRACACHWAFALFLVARHLPIVCGFPATDTGRLPHPFYGSALPAVCGSPRH